jgi:arsenite-transporting ATPase
VVVNRVFPDEAADGYFGAWAETHRRQMELVRSAFAPVPILPAPYFEQEVIGPQMLDRLGDVLFEDGNASAILFDELTQELETNNGTANLRLTLPFAEKADIGLKKIGMEVVVRVGTQKRTIVLPQALASYRPAGARFEDGALNVVFEKETSGDPH